MSGQVFVFFLFALLAIISAWSVVSTPDPVHSALWLILNLICIAVLYYTLNAPFLMAVQLIVYAGAIVVLFLFVVMLLNTRGDEAAAAPMPWLRKWSIGGALLLLLGIVWVVKVKAPDGPGGAIVVGDPAAIGRVLYGPFLLPFEATSLLLLVALVGALYLGRGNNRKNAGFGIAEVGPNDE